MKQKPQKPTKTLDPRTARRAQQARLRCKAYEQRKREAKRHRGDRLRFYQVPMLDSDVGHLVADLELTERDDNSNRNWRRLVGRAIAAAARLALRK
jgi:hypothetical protein